MADKYLFIIYAGKETHEGLGRIFNALVMAKEIKQLGKTVEIVFDGAGTEWVPELEDENNKLNSMYKEVKDCVSAICDYCTSAFEVEGIEEDPRIKNDFMGHPSMAKYFEEDYQIVTF